GDGRRHNASALHGNEDYNARRGGPAGSVPAFLVRVVRSSGWRMASGKKRWELTQAAFDKLLAQLDADVERAAHQYEVIRQGIMRFFECRGSAAPADLRLLRGRGGGEDRQPQAPGRRPERLDLRPSAAHAPPAQRAGSLRPDVLRKGRRMRFNSLSRPGE